MVRCGVTGCVDGGCPERARDSARTVDSFVACLREVERTEGQRGARGGVKSENARHHQHQQQQLRLHRRRATVPLDTAGRAIVVSHPD